MVTGPIFIYMRRATWAGRLEAAGTDLFDENGSEVLLATAGKSRGEGCVTREMDVIKHTHTNIISHQQRPERTKRPRSAVSPQNNK
jgi:hypothetical protein